MNVLQFIHGLVAFLIAEPGSIALPKLFSIISLDEGVYTLSLCVSAEDSYGVPAGRSASVIMPLRDRIIYIVIYICDPVAYLHDLSFRCDMA